MHWNPSEQRPRHNSSTHTQLKLPPPPKPSTGRAMIIPVRCFTCGKVRTTVATRPCRLASSSSTGQPDARPSLAPPMSPRKAERGRRGQPPAHALDPALALLSTPLLVRRLGCAPRTSSWSRMLVVECLRSVHQKRGGRLLLCVCCIRVVRSHPRNACHTAALIDERCSRQFGLDASVAWLWSYVRDFLCWVWFGFSLHMG